MASYATSLLERRGESMGFSSDQIRGELVRYREVCALGALKVYGGPEAVAEHERAVRDALGATAPALPDTTWTDAGPLTSDETVRVVAEWMDTLAFLRERLAAAEALLAAGGWRFNRAKGRAERAGPGNPYQFLRRVIVDVADSLRTDDPDRNDSELRHQVATRLSFFLDPEEISAEKDGSIDRHLKNEFRDTPRPKRR